MMKGVLVIMLALRGYSNGKYVIPIGTTVIPENVEVIITFLDDAADERKSNLTWFQELCAELNADTEELPEEYDNILSERLNIGRELNL